MGIEDKIDDIANEQIQKMDKLGSQISTTHDAVKRLRYLAENTPEYLKELDRTFEEATSLNKKDSPFLFVATALQVARIIIINILTRIEKAGPKNEMEKRLHEIEKEIYKKLGLDQYNESSISKLYYASLKQIVTTTGVPFDATTFLNGVRDNMFKGGNHRYSTLGHDPVLGLIFGTANILTNTITVVTKEESVNIKGHEIGIPTSNHVVYDAFMKNSRIDLTQPCSTAETLVAASQRFENDKKAVVAALIKEIIHLGTDLYTPAGIQFPGSNLILSKTNVEKLTKMVSYGDLIKISTSAKISEMINLVICIFHTLTYDENNDGDARLFNFRTRKILDYSEAMATGSSLITTGIRHYAGDDKAIKDFDFGGLLILLQRIWTDVPYMKELKREFIFSNYRHKLVDEEF